MQNPNPAEDSTNKSPSSPDPRPPPHTPSPTPTENTTSENVATAERGTGVAGSADRNVGIIPLQVPHLTSGGDHHGGGSPVAAAVGEGGSSAAVAVGSGSSVALAVEKGGQRKMTVEDTSSGGRRQKRKSQLTDLPPGPPTCPICGKLFPSWKSAFGHMRAHPERDYRGFFRPPVFSSSSQTRQRVQDQVAGESTGGEKGSSSPARRLELDLNKSMEGVGSSEAVQKNEVPESSAAEKNEEDKKVGFDLNELPPAEDDDDKP